MTLVTGESDNAATDRLRQMVDDMLSELHIVTRVGFPTHHFEVDGTQYVYKTYRLFEEGVIYVPETDGVPGRVFNGDVDNAIEWFATGLGSLLEFGSPLVWRSQPTVYEVFDEDGDAAGWTARCRCIQVPTVEIADAAGRIGDAYEPGAVIRSEARPWVAE